MIGKHWESRGESVGKKHINLDHEPQKLKTNVRIGSI